MPRNLESWPRRIREFGSGDRSTSKKNMHPLDVNDNSAVYYDGQYWNNLDCTNRMINRRISGDEAVNWWRHFARQTGKVFERALILNCGNGWVEREMFDGGLIREAVGIDYSEELLSEARSAAEGRRLHYVRTNINAQAYPAGRFDLVVNHAAAHHVVRLDRVFRNLCRLLPHDGWLLSLDYVGPHRNEYSLDAWDQAWKLNQTLPDHVRQSMTYPLRDLYVQVDPTEAVHSELIVDILHRYFHVAEFHSVGRRTRLPDPHAQLTTLLNRAGPWRARTLGTNRFGSRYRISRQKSAVEPVRVLFGAAQQGSPF